MKRDSPHCEGWEIRGRGESLRIESKGFVEFTIERTVLIKMLKQVGGRGHKGETAVKLSACAARVFVSTNIMVAGNEAMVLEDGECVLSGRKLRLVLE